jgi:hypothetical protein
MTAPLLITPETTRRALSRCHASRNEYFDWVRDVFAATPSSIKSRRYFYNRFVRHWPNLVPLLRRPLLETPTADEMTDLRVPRLGRRVSPPVTATPSIEAVMTPWACSAESIGTLNITLSRLAGTSCRDRVVHHVYAPAAFMGYRA